MHGCSDLVRYSCGMSRSCTHANSHGNRERQCERLTADLSGRITHWERLRERLLLYRVGKGSRYTDHGNSMGKGGSGTGKARSMECHGRVGKGSGWFGKGKGRAGPALSRSLPSSTHRAIEISHNRDISFSLCVSFRATLANSCAHIQASSCVHASRFFVALCLCIS